MSATEVTHPDATILTIFGAGGDLAWRKLFPALYSLFLDRSLPERFAIIGLDRKPMRDDAFRRRLREGVNRFGRRGRAKPASWNAFARQVAYLSGDFSDTGVYRSLAGRLAAQTRAWGAPANHVFYLATPPAVVEAVAGHLKKAGLSSNPARARIVLEKPFGRDLASSRALTRSLRRAFREPQIYRIDHYLGKETVQNILALRFANALFEPIWDRRYVDHVQITVAEQVGVEGRGNYYERAGALRDMVQNHLLQILCLIAMEPPVSFEPDEIRNKKVDVLRAVRPMPAALMPQMAVRGQYGPGKIAGKRVPGYRSEPDVAPDSSVETFAAVKLLLDNWRWEDVPFYLRTGKRLPVKASEVAIEFRPAPHLPFPAAAVERWQPNRLIICIEPDEGILLRFQAKQPGPVMHLNPVPMRFTYREAFRTPAPEAYETLLLDVMRGDATLFMRADQIDTAWSVAMPVLEFWQANPPQDFPNYAAGTWGPPTADALIGRDARAWLPPVALESRALRGADQAAAEERAMTAAARSVSAPASRNRASRGRGGRAS